MDRGAADYSHGNTALLRVWWPRRSSEERYLAGAWLLEGGMARSSGKHWIMLAKQFIELFLKTIRAFSPGDDCPHGAYIWVAQDAVKV